MDLSVLATEMNVDSSLERLCGDPAFLLELLDMLVAEFNAEQATLVARLNQNDYQYLATKAHYYKGIAANLELTHFFEAASALEKSTKLNDETACNAHAHKLIACAQRITSLLQGLVRH